MPSLLIIDDEPNVRFSLKRAFQGNAIDITTAENGQQGIDAVRKHPPDAVLLDVKLPDRSGMDVFREIQTMDQRIPVVMITAHGSTHTAIEAMKHGAFEYLVKPLDLTELRRVVDRAMQASRLSRAVPITDSDSFPSVEDGYLVGRSRGMQDVYKAIGRVAPSDVTVLLLGESGTGKELVASAIVQHSRRANGPFLAVNCAAIPEGLLESELFGHERGAFTGAERRRIGRFEQASGGTIFLDEIGDMSGATQAKVLRLLQDQRFERVGGTEVIQTDTRIIAATNQDLSNLVLDGRFRRDLYYRLNVYSITLPPLRERMEDLPDLVDHFLAVAAAEVGRRVRQVAPETLELLANYNWPGNVRELQGVVKNALVNAATDVLTPDCLPTSLRERDAFWIRLSESHAIDLNVTAIVRRLLEDGQYDIYHKTLLAVDHTILHEVLRAVGDNQVEAARRLGISRTTLRAKLQNIANYRNKGIKPDGQS